MNMIKNCPITQEDIDLSERIYGANVLVLKGKTTRSKPKLTLQDYIKIPSELKNAYQGIHLCAVLMYIQGIIFLVMVSKNIKFITIQCILTRSKSLVCKAFDQTFRVYNKAGFKIDTIYVDPEFKVLKYVFINNDITMNYATAQGHVPEIERKSG